MQKIRNSNIELLRIIAIIMIILSHYTVHNGVINSELKVGLNRFILEAATLGNIGTIIFILISGYFLINDNKFSFKKFCLLFFQILFYTLLFYFISIIFLNNKFSIKSFIECLLPLTFKRYWFMSVYMLLYIFHPFINLFLKKMTQKQYFTFLFISILIFYFYRTICSIDIYGNELIQFLIIYSIGGYLKLYNSILFTKKYNVIIIFVMSFILLLSLLFFDIVSIRYNDIGKYSLYFFSRTSIFILVLSISIFQFFVNRKEFSSKLINSIASCMFGVYLIHENKNISSFLWIDLFNNYKFVNSNLLVPHMIFSVLLVFLVCVIIEFIRKNTIEKIIIKYLLPFVEKIQIKINSIYNNVLKKYFNL